MLLACRWILLVSLGFSVQARAPQSTQLPEYLLKARVIRALADFVTWPQTELKSKNAASLAVLGNSPFEGYLDAEFQAIPVPTTDRPVEYLRRWDYHRQARMLFISSSEGSQLAQILENLKGKPVLTISDTAGFAHRGVMVNLVLVDRKVKMEVNLGAVRASGLQMSSQVLKRVTLVDDQP